MKGNRSMPGYDRGKTNFTDTEIFLSSFIWNVIPAIL